MSLNSIKFDYIVTTSIKKVQFRTTQIGYVTKFKIKYYLSQKIYFLYF